MRRQNVMMIAVVKSKKKVRLWGVALLALTAGACGTPAQPSQPEPLTPKVLAVTPNAGSILGGAQITVLLEDVTANAELRFGNTRLGNAAGRGVAPPVFFVPPGGQAGPVDVIIDNRNGRIGVLPGGFTYVDPSSFDFNGSWQGFGWDFGEDLGMPLGFTIENGVLIRFSCGAEGVITPVPGVPVTSGAFAYTGHDGVKVSGRVVADGQASGMLQMPGCHPASWRADRR